MRIRARIWISGYLDSGKNNLLLHPHSEILCGAALPGAFFSEKTRSWNSGPHLGDSRILEFKKDAERQQTRVPKV